MKIVCLITPRPHAYAFVAAVHAEFPVSLIIVEHKEKQNESLTSRLSARMKTEGIFGVFGNHLRYVFFRKKNNSPLEASLRKHFGDTWRSLPAGVPVLRVSDINSPDVINRLTHEKPDVMLDHGTSIVCTEVIERARFTMNLHWGLSPYYRGSYCTKDALLERDPLNIGVTIHSLSAEVDGGGIIGQSYAEVHPDDTASTIDVQLTSLGTEVVLQALRLMRDGKMPVLHPQNLSVGRVSRKKDWNAAQELRLKAVQKRGLQDMLNKPSRQRLPIITLS